MNERTCVRQEGNTCRVTRIEAVAHLSLTTWVLTLQLQQGPEEGPQRDARAHAHSAGNFISGVNRG